MSRILPRSFYERDTVKVAKELLGKLLVHETSEGRCTGKIIETEAYLGPEDPASRAFKGRTRLSSPMWGKAGLSFIYMVHGHWLFNIVAKEGWKVGAVLIRALEPIEGIEIMKRRRRTDNLRELTSGPGKLTQALGITQKQHLLDLTKLSSKLKVMRGVKEKFEIGKSHRIGVTHDLPQKLRFFIKGSKFISI